MRRTLDQRRWGPVAQLLTIGALAAAAASPHAQDSNLGNYGQPSTYCGHAPIPVNGTSIPQIGCFVLSSGRSAQGTLAGHLVNVSVDAKGQEVFAVDGTVVVETFEPKKQPSRFTNLPFVHTRGVAGYGICQVATDDACPVNITVFDRRPDKTILFVVSECLAPGYRVCVSTQENWDYELSRSRSQ
jgi:hypothetical protein